MTEKWDAHRTSSLAFNVGCASQVIWVMLTDILNYMKGPYEELLGYQYLALHVIWLAPILALWILRRLPSVTILYALSLVAILVSSLPEFLRVIYGHGSKQTLASLAAAAIGVVSLVVIFLWLLDRLVDLVFITIQRIVGVFRNG